MQPSENQSFRTWIAGFRSRAKAAGIGMEVLDRALDDVEYLPSVIEKDRHQSEFIRTIWDYLDAAVSPDRIAEGQAALDVHRDLLERIEHAYGVEKEVVVAIWGMESAYGRLRGNVPTIAALATLAFDGRRGAFFETQLVAALRILQAGDVDARKMTGSWAGAMGHTQFMPTSFLDHAVDFNGDGRRDIWSDDPADALASAAAYLRHFGWRRGEPWGVEVRIPEGFDYGLTGAETTKTSAADWTALGIRDLDGDKVPDHGAASILLPAGVRGAAFMVFRNFHVIERYNAADAYVIGAGHLADRIAGRAQIRAGWPRGERGLLAAERQELQQRLTDAGFSTGGVDGRIGPNTIAAIRAFQRMVGLVPDGYASLEVLERLRLSGEPPKDLRKLS